MVNVATVIASDG